MPTAGAVLIGGAVAMLGLLVMWFRVPLATFFREERARRASRNASSRTPALVFVVGAGFFAIGAFIAVGSLARWVHPK